MSLLDPALHAQHGDQAVCLLPGLGPGGGAPACLLCLFSSLASAGLNTRKIYTLRSVCVIQCGEEGCLWTMRAAEVQGTFRTAARLTAPKQSPFLCQCTDTESIPAAHRNLLDQLCAPDTGAQVLRELCSRHAGVVVPGLLDALSTASDPGLVDHLQELAHLLCTSDQGAVVCTMLAEALLMLLSQQAQGGPGLAPCITQLLPLVVSSAEASSIVARTLLCNPDLCSVLIALLDPDSGSPVAALDGMLRFLLTMFDQPSEDSARLVAASGPPAFAAGVKLLCRACSAGAAAAAPASSLHDVKVSSLGLLGLLVSCGGPSLLEQVTVAWGPGAQQSMGSVQSLADLTADLAAGIKAAILCPVPAVQGAAAQLAAGVCRWGHPQMLRLLMQHDLCEHLCECIRGALQAAGQGAPGVQLLGCSTGAGAGGGAGGGAPDQAAQERAAGLQVLCCTALRFLSYQGGPAGLVSMHTTHAFCTCLLSHCLLVILSSSTSSCQQQLYTGPEFKQHLHYALDTLVLVAESAAACCNTPLLADVLALLVLAFGSGQDGGGGATAGGQWQPSASLMRRAVALVGVM